MKKRYNTNDWDTNLNFDYDVCVKKAYDSAINSIKEWANQKENVIYTKLIFKVKNSYCEGHLPKAIMIGTSSNKLYLYQLITGYAIDSQETGKVLNKGSMFEYKETIETQVRQVYLRRKNWNSYDEDKTIK